MLRIPESFSSLNLATKHRLHRPLGQRQRRVRSTVHFWLAALTALLIVALPWSSAEAGGTASAITTNTPTNERLAHARVSGRLGPWRRVEVVLTQSNEVDDAPFSGVVIARDAGGSEVRAVLPRPYEPESLFMMKVRSVIFRIVDLSRENELIVLFFGTKN